MLFSYLLEVLPKIPSLLTGFFEIFKVKEFARSMSKYTCHLILRLAVDRFGDPMKVELHFSLVELGGADSCYGPRLISIINNLFVVFVISLSASGSVMPVLMLSLSHRFIMFQ
jgi:hypothetical protein